MIRIPQGLHPGGRGQRKCDARTINYTVNNATPTVFRFPNADFHSFSPLFLTKQIGKSCTVLHRMIHYTGTDPAMGQPPNDQSSYDEDFLNYVLKELIEQLEIFSSCLNSFVAATEASMRFSAVLHMGGTAIASSSQPVRCSNSNCNSNNITSITNLTRAAYTGSVAGSTIVEGAMLLGG